MTSTNPTSSTPEAGSPRTWITLAFTPQKADLTAWFVYSEGAAPAEVFSMPIIGYLTQQQFQFGSPVDSRVVAAIRSDSDSELIPVDSLDPEFNTLMRVCDTDGWPKKNEADRWIEQARVRQLRAA